MNELSEGWVKDKLGNLVDISIGKTPKRSEPRYWQNGIHKWATIASMDFGKELTKTAEHITDDALRETKPRKVSKDTLLFSFKLTIGKMAFAGCDLYTNEAIAAAKDAMSKAVIDNLLSHIEIKPTSQYSKRQLYRTINPSSRGTSADVICNYTHSG